MKHCECFTTVGSYPGETPGETIAYCVREWGHPGAHQAELWFPDVDCEHAGHPQETE
jgi:hypothetical protein